MTTRLLISGVALIAALVAHEAAESHVGSAAPVGRTTPTPAIVAELPQPCTTATTRTVCDVPSTPQPRRTTVRRLPRSTPTVGCLRDVCRTDPLDVTPLVLP